jgi:hypothetical protein
LPFLIFLENVHVQGVKDKVIYHNQVEITQFLDLF